MPADRPERAESVSGIEPGARSDGGSSLEPGVEPRLAPEVGSGAESAAASPTWDPTGLDLARSVAGAIARSQAGGTRGRAAGRRRRTGSRSAAEARGSGGLSGSGPDERDPQALDSTMDRLVADRGWTTDVAVAGAMARWAEIVGPEIAAHCRAEAYTDTELTVRAESTAWATQVRLLAPTLVRRLAQELGDGTVTRVNVLGPTAPSWRRGPLSVRDGRGPRDTYG